MTLACLQTSLGSECGCINLGLPVVHSPTIEAFGVTAEGLIVSDGGRVCWFESWIHIDRYPIQTSTDLTGIPRASVRTLILRGHCTSYAIPTAAVAVVIDAGVAEAIGYNEISRKIIIVRLPGRSLTFAGGST